MDVECDLLLAFGDPKREIADFLMSLRICCIRYLARECNRCRTCINISKSYW